MILIRPYRKGSKSVSALCKNIAGMKKMKLVNSKYRWNPLDTIINWGNTSEFYFENMPQYEDCMTILNKPWGIRLASNKLKFFQRIKEHNAGQNFVNVPIPRFVTNKNDIAITGLKFPIYCRTKLNGYGGDGIVVAQKPDELVDAPLYVEGIKKAREYRFHVARRMTIFSEEFGVLEYNNCFFLQQKKRRQGDNPDGIIKNKSSGWVFCHENITQPSVNMRDQITKYCVYLLDLFDLDFGAFDVLIKGDLFWILELNTAPGFEDNSTTCVKYETMLHTLTHHFPYPCLGEGGG